MNQEWERRRSLKNSESEEQVFIGISIEVRDI
jgi:hypothetical protein